MALRKLPFPAFPPRQLAFIAEVTTDIRYVKRETNFVADTLSRPTVSFVDNTSTINYKDLSTDQALDTEFTRLRHSKSSTMNFKLLKSFDNNLIWCDVSTGHIRPYVTEKFRKQVFSNLHGLGHPSHRATKPLINTRFVWHGMNIDIAKWFRSCKGCQTAKISRHNKPIFRQIRRTHKEIGPHTYRYSRTLAVCRWFQLSTVLCRSLHTLARSHTASGYQS